MINVNKTALNGKIQHPELCLLTEFLMEEQNDWQSFPEIDHNILSEQIVS